jgi:hypothetical protein
MAAEEPVPLETSLEISEQSVLDDLFKICDNLEERLLSSSEEEVELVADLIQKGMNGARADDTKSMKAAIIDWITPRGQNLTPPLSRKIKTSRGFHHERTGTMLCPAGMDWSVPRVKERLRSGETRVSGEHWPMFLYADLSYDEENPWNGLMRGELLVTGYKHIFTSPSSVDDDEPKATRSGNARLHGMTSVTKASLAYVATQVRFALCSASTFSRADTVTDSETFYNSVLDFLNDVEEKVEVQDLLSWWNRRVFPQTFNSLKGPVEGSARARIKEKRRAHNRANTQSGAD